MNNTIISKNNKILSPIGYIVLDNNFKVSGINEMNDNSKLWIRQQILNSNKNKSFIECKDSYKIPVFDNDYSFLNIMKFIINNTKNFDFNLDIKNEHDKFVSNISNVIKLKDNYTAYHSLHVQEYSLAISRYLGFTKEELNKIYTAAHLHDIGKIIINNEIINKKEKLSYEEFEEIKLHTSQGWDILSDIDTFDEIATIVKQHHERFDGEGYPDGVKEDAIHIMARIIGVADSFDAMTTDRPYRNAMSVEGALKELEKNKFTQFDGRIVNLFAYLIRNKKVNYLGT